MNGVLLLEYSELIEKYGIARGTIDCSVSKFFKKESTSWASIKNPHDKRKRLIIYNSIPAHSRKNLPSEEELIRLCTMKAADLNKIYQLLSEQNF